MNDWFGGKTEPTSYSERLFTNSSDLQWKPADPNANAIGVLVLPQAFLQPIAANPVPSSPPVDPAIPEKAIHQDYAGYCWTGPHGIAVEDANGNPI